MLRIRNEGVPITGSSKKGDLYIKIIVEIPTHLSSKAKAALEAYAKIQGEKENPEILPLSHLRN